MQKLDIALLSNIRQHRLHKLLAWTLRQPQKHLEGGARFRPSPADRPGTRIVCGWLKLLSTVSAAFCRLGSNRHYFALLSFWFLSRRTVLDVNTRITVPSSQKWATIVNKHDQFHSEGKCFHCPVTFRTAFYIWTSNPFCWRWYCSELVDFLFGPKRDFNKYHVSWAKICQKCRALREVSFDAGKNINLFNFMMFCHIPNHKYYKFERSWHVHYYSRAKIMSFFVLDTRYEYHTKCRPRAATSDQVKLST